MARLAMSTVKAKGRETENRFVEWVNERYGMLLERRRLNGVLDQGDVTGWPGVCVEVKSGASLDIPGWLRELDNEIVNSGADTGFVAVRPKGKPDPSDWYAVLPLPVLMGLMQESDRLPTV